MSPCFFFFFLNCISFLDIMDHTWKVQGYGLLWNIVQEDHVVIWYGKIEVKSNEGE